mgnify:FL=1
MKCYEFANNLKNSNNDIDKMLLVCLMLNFSEQDITVLKNKYGETVIKKFQEYLEGDKKDKE